MPFLRSGVSNENVTVTRDRGSHSLSIMVRAVTAGFVSDLGSNKN